MPTKTTAKKQKKSTPPKPLWLAPLLLIAGIVGLIWAVNSSEPINNPATSSSGSELQVRSSGTGSTNQSQAEAASQLQGAAKTNDLIKGRDANNLQQGSTAETLTKDSTFQ